MRVAVIFFGIVRRVETALDSIKTNIFDCNATEGISLYAVASLNIVDSLNNPRTGELGVKLNPADVFALDADFYALARQDDDAIAEPLALAQRRSDAYRNEWSSVRNLLHQLTSLHRAWTICTDVVNTKFDYFLFVRPDLLYLDPIRVADLVPLFQHEGSILLPEWHSFGGFNDRLAFADPVAARHYAERLFLVSEFCARRPLHSESLLAHAMQKGGCRVGRLPVRARRIRAHGSIVRDGFDVATIALPARPQAFSFVPGSAPLFETIGETTEVSDQEPHSEAAGGHQTVASAPRRQTIGGFARVAPLAGLNYLDFLAALHRRRPVARYLEIGTQSGRSLGQATGRALAIDPRFMLDKAAWSARPGITLHEMTSDSFFAAHDPTALLGGTIDLAFIDGMHLSDFVLRDFVNVERFCAPDSLIILHDAIPNNFEMTERNRRPGQRADKALAGAWTGDVWRVIPLLRRERPDLRVEILDCQPTGLVLVSNLDPRSRVLAQRLDELSFELTESEPPEAAFWSFIEQLELVDSRTVLARLSAADAPA